MSPRGKYAPRTVRLLAALCAVSLLAIAAVASARIFMAEELAGRATEDDLKKAVKLAPANSQAWAQLGALLEKRGDTEGAVRALERAVELSRYDPAAWVSLGVHWEIEGDPQRAERCLLEAARVDRTFFPRWALANFYLRQGGGERFWAAMRDAIASNRDDLTSAFELCWRAYGDAEQILQKAIPDKPETNRAYLRFLLSTGRAMAAAAVWNRIAGQLQPPDLQLAKQYMEALLVERVVDDAVNVWNRLCQAGLMRYAALDPARGLSLTNGNFRLALGDLPFDWRLGEVEGITAMMGNNPGSRSGLTIRFSGAHPETAELLSQLAPAAENETYQLRYRYSTSGLPADTGLYWMVEDGPKGGKLMEGQPLPAAEERWTAGSARFQTGPKTNLIRIAFAYRRSPGTTRAQGSVSLTDVEVSPVSRKLDPDRRGPGVRP